MTIVTVSSGVVSNGLSVTSGNQLVVLNGGEADNTVVSSGGLMTLSSGGLAYVLNVSSGGKVVGAGVVGSNSYDYVAGSISGVQLGDAFRGYAVVELYSGASASGVVGANTYFTVDSGASATATLLSYQGGNLGQALENLYGTTTGTVVSAGGNEQVYSGGVASGTSVSNGGFEYVNSGGVAKSTVVSSGGTEFVYDGGAISGASVKGGGLLIISAGGSVTGASVSSGGTIDYAVQIIGGQTLLAGLQTSTTVLSGATVSSGGYLDVDGATVLSGGALTLLSGAIVNGLTVQSGGVLTLSSGGLLSNVTVFAGGKLAGGGIVGGYSNAYVAGSISGVQLGDPAAGYGFLEVQSAASQAA
jgi:autotransporter passenger strand-loop-strand repeat protein